MSAKKAVEVTRSSTGRRIIRAVAYSLLMLFTYSIWSTLHHLDDLHVSDYLTNRAVAAAVYITGGPFHYHPPSSDNVIGMASLWFKRVAERTFVRYPFWVGDVTGVPPQGEGMASISLVKPSGLGANETRPIIFWFHKGGFVVGHSLERDWIPRLVSHGFVVASVEYPLSPESIFPETFETVLRTLLYFLRDHPDKATTMLHADLSKVIVGGYSAGGNLAATISQQLAKEGINLKAHLVAAGALRFHDFDELNATIAEFPSIAEAAHHATLTIEDLKWFWSAYCPSAEVCRDDPRVQSHDAISSRTSPAVVYVGASDVLRDENRKYAEDIRRAGSRSKLVLGKGSHWGSVLFDLDGVGKAIKALDSCVYRECDF